MLSDLRAALGQVRRHPWFFTGAALSLAIGMSVATAVFSVVDAIALRPLPFHDPDRLVIIAEAVPSGSGWSFRSAVPSGHMVAVREARHLSGVAAWTYASYSLGGVGRDTVSATERAALVTTSFFGVLGVRPAIGRDFDRHEGRAGARAVMLSHDLWETRFGRDPSVVGREITLDDSTYRVAGVMAKKVGFPRVRLWVAIPDSVIDASARAEMVNTPPSYLGLARLARGSSIEQLSAEVAVLYERIYASHPLRGVRSSRAQALSGYISGWFGDEIQLWSAIAFVVAILCAVNFATMSLARGLRRRGEIAVRSALGASAFRVVRLLVAESVLIALAGGAGAILLGAWLLRFVASWFAGGLIVLEPTLSWMTLAFGLAGTTVVGIAFALAPAIELAKVDLRSRLQGNAANSTTRGGELRGRRLLVGLQLAFALTAVASLAALVEADRRHWSVDAGIAVDGLLLGNFVADSAVRLPAPLLLERLRSSPGVTSAAVIGRLRGVTAWTDDPAADAFSSMSADISPNYFATLGLPLLVGRLPTREETAVDAKLIVLSRGTAIQAFGSDSNAIGKRLHVRAVRRQPTWFTVVGVVPDVGGALWVTGSYIYIMNDRDVQAGVAVVRAVGRAGDRGRELATVMAPFRPQLTLGNIRSARALLDAEQAERRGRALFVMSVAALALVLAVIGMYGLTSYNAESRARELGIRVALGASPARLASALLGELWAVGIIGTLVAFIAASRVTSLLDMRLRNPLAEHPLITLDPWAALAAAVGLVVVMLLGAGMPMRKVLRLDVMRAIHSGTAEGLNRR